MLVFLNLGKFDVGSAGNCPFEFDVILFKDGGDISISDIPVFCNFVDRFCASEAFFYDACLLFVREYWSLDFVLLVFFFKALLFDIT